ncbi:MAG: pyruvate formate lyase family protein [Desulfomonile sp.]
MTSKVTLGDVTLRGITLDQYPDLKALRDVYFKAVPEMCVERPELITKYHSENSLFTQDKISVLDKAKAYRYVLQNRYPVVRHNLARDKYDKDFKEFEFTNQSPFAGSTTRKFKGVLLYPELFGLVMWPELHSVGKRRPNPFYLSKDDAQKLNLEVYPHWMEKTVWEIARHRHYENQFHDPTITDNPDEMKLLQNVVFFLTSKAICISHCIPDFSRAVNSGLLVMIKEANEREQSTPDSETSKKVFYQAVQEVLKGIIEYAKNLSGEAKRLADIAHDNDDLDEESRLIEICNIYNKVPEQEATSFREALTTLWVCWTSLHLESPNIGLSLGRLDQLLYPFYKEEIKNLNQKDRLKFDQNAVKLLCYFWLKIGDHVPTMLEAGEQLFGGTGSNQAVTIGGVDINGKDAVNDVTYLILRAAQLMQLRDPNLAARYHPEVNSQDYLKILVESNILTRAIPAIHNDKAVIKALTSKGDPEEFANDYGIVGCVEPTSAGRTFGHCAAIILNLASALELALFNGKHRHTHSVQVSPKTGNPVEFKFDQFFTAFKQQTSWLIDRSSTLNDHLGRTHQDFYPTPILSAFIKGPMDKGMDVTQGGADINSSGAAIVGLADVVDSISAIKKWVFDEKIITFSSLLDAIQADFNEYEDIRFLLGDHSKTPKFGNEDQLADDIARDIVNFLDEKFRNKINYRGARYRVGYWTMTFHAGMGKFTRSLPNGRGARESFASGITPVSNVSGYLSKNLNSVSNLPCEALSSGAALNIKCFPEEDLSLMGRNLAATINAFFGKGVKQKDGGLQIQFNVVSRETLEKAMQRPEDYRYLLVRVSGYSAYFVDLNTDMQEEILHRTEYLVSPGYRQPDCVEIVQELKH